MLMGNSTVILFNTVYSELKNNIKNKAAVPV